jgi:RimJ/RimL family protein N-acetyltransferase
VILKTKRLLLRELTVDDADFILRLLNEPSFLHYIGDKGVRDLEGARQYILTGPVASYKRNGFGLFLVALQGTNISIGICGLIKREELEDVDIGFAFLPEFWNNGFAFEAAKAVLAHGRDVLKLHRVVAITNVDNHASARVLEKLGLRFGHMIRLSTDRAETRLFVPAGDAQ